MAAGIGRLLCLAKDSTNVIEPVQPIRSDGSGRTISYLKQTIKSLEVPEGTEYGTTNKGLIGVVYASDPRDDRYSLVYTKRGKVRIIGHYPVGVWLRMVVKDEQVTHAEAKTTPMHTRIIPDTLEKQVLWLYGSVKSTAKRTRVNKYLGEVCDPNGLLSDHDQVFTEIILLCQDPLCPKLEAKKIHPPSVNHSHSHRLKPTSSYYNKVDGTLNDELLQSEATAELIKNHIPGLILANENTPIMPKAKPQIKALNRHSSILLVENEDDERLKFDSCSTDRQANRAPQSMRNTEYRSESESGSSKVRPLERPRRKEIMEPRASSVTVQQNSSEFTGREVVPLARPRLSQNQTSNEIRLFNRDKERNCNNSDSEFWQGSYERSYRSGNRSTCSGGNYHSSTYPIIETPSEYEYGNRHVHKFERKQVSDYNWLSGSGLQFPRVDFTALRQFGVYPAMIPVNFLIVHEMENAFVIFAYPDRYGLIEFERIPRTLKVKTGDFMAGFCQEIKGLFLKCYNLVYVARLQHSLSTNLPEVSVTRSIRERNQFAVQITLSSTDISLMVPDVQYILATTPWGVVVFDENDIDLDYLDRPFLFLAEHELGYNYSWRCIRKKGNQNRFQGMQSTRMLADGSYQDYGYSGNSGRNVLQHSGSRGYEPECNRRWNSPRKFISHENYVPDKSSISKPPFQYHDGSDKLTTNKVHPTFSKEHIARNANDRSVNREAEDYYEVDDSEVPVLTSRSKYRPPAGYSNISKPIMTQRDPTARFRAPPSHNDSSNEESMDSDGYPTPMAATPSCNVEANNKEIIEKEEDTLSKTSAQEPEPRKKNRKGYTQAGFDVSSDDESEDEDPLASNNTRGNGSIDGVAPDSAGNSKLSIGRSSANGAEKDEAFDLSGVTMQLESLGSTNAGAFGGLRNLAALQTIASSDAEKPVFVVQKPKFEEDDEFNFDDVLLKSDDAEIEPVFRVAAPGFNDDEDQFYLDETLPNSPANPQFGSENIEFSESDEEDVFKFRGNGRAQRAIESQKERTS